MSSALAPTLATAPARGRTRIGGTSAVLALLRANVLYWPVVAPAVRRRLDLWAARAAAIPDPALRALAQDKLHRERFNVELAATLAILSPRAGRTHAVEAIVALQVAYDYLDVLTEPPVARELLPDPPSDSRRLLAALSDALGPRAEAERDRCPGCATGAHPQAAAGGGRRLLDDGGYLCALVGAVRDAVARLPAWDSVTGVARRSAARCAEAQALGHMAIGASDAELERWARREAAGSGMGWPEWFAGAQASVLGLHALIAAAADERTTHADAERLDRLYLAIGAVTMLDSLVDREQDLAAGERGYVRWYESPARMGARLADAARDAARRARDVPHGSHHLMTLGGVIAYYASAPPAGDPLARAVLASVRAELAPPIAPTLTVMRAWRVMKAARAHLLSHAPAGVTNLGRGLGRV